MDRNALALRHWIRGVFLDTEAQKLNKEKERYITSARELMLDALNIGDAEQARMFYESYNLTKADFPGGGRDEFIHACTYGHLEAAKWLCKACDLCWQDVFHSEGENDHLPLIAAVKYNHPDVAKWLVDTFY